MSNKPFTIIWKQFNADSPLGEHLNATKDFALPYLIDGNEIEDFQSGKFTDLKELHLLRGIILGYSESPDIKNIEYSKSLFPAILSDLSSNYNINDTETLLLDISAFIRQENGMEACFMALKNATEILPNSSKLKFDCCIALYTLLEDNKFPDFKEGVKLINRLSDEIDPNQISPELVKHIDSFKIDIEKL